MIAHPSTKYRPFPVIDLSQRRWPTRQLDQAPIWLSTDLRDGNQALFEPMNLARKQRLFEELVRIGFKEIEVGFPAASKIDFEFVRHLVDDDLIPSDVTPMVITQARADLIEQTVRSVQGARRAIVHMYNATAPVWREVVFGLSVAQVMALIEQHVTLLQKLTDAQPQTQWVLQYSPETFSMTELVVSLQACNTAIAAWGAGPDRPIIINLPTTVEVATPNVFADQVEWMHERLDQRAHVVLSVHTHNDRGTGVACAELAQMAGAQRVEGCLFGNGERSGNVDLVTLALNLYTQGVHPGLDFSDLARVARVAEDCTALPIHPRHPYAGDLVFTAFSGSHQDAIKKGFAAQAHQAIWQVPYLPIDPKDVGRTYDSVVRLNSQSGKGGMAFLLERDHGVSMPRRMQIELAGVVQVHTESSEAELSSAALWQLFERTYLDSMAHRLAYVSHQLFDDPAGQGVVLHVRFDGQVQCWRGVGNGPIDAVVQALQIPLRIDSYEERSLGLASPPVAAWGDVHLGSDPALDLRGAKACAMAIIEAAGPDASVGTRFGVGCSTNIVTASVLAIFSVVHRLGLIPATPPMLG